MDATFGSDIRDRAHQGRTLAAKSSFLMEPKQQDRIILALRRILPRDRHLGSAPLWGAFSLPAGAAQGAHVWLGAQIFCQYSR